MKIKHASIIAVTMLLSVLATVVFGQQRYMQESGSWTVPPTSGAIPSGMVLMVVSGSCPATWTELTSMAGKMPYGTVAANGDVGTTGGSDSITPAGTNGTVGFTPTGSVAAPTFTGSSATSSAVSAGTPAGTNGTATTGATSGGTPAGTNGTTTTGGTAIAATATAALTSAAAAGQNTANNTHTHPSHTHTVPAEVFTGSTLATHTHTVPAETFTGSALGTHTHTLTATGTNSTPAFTGNSGIIPAEIWSGIGFDNRSAWVKVIYCSKD